MRSMITTLLTLTCIAGYVTSAHAVVEEKDGIPYSTWQGWTFDRDGLNPENIMPDDGLKAWNGAGTLAPTDGGTTTHIKLNSPLGSSSVTHGGFFLAPGDSFEIHVDNWKDTMPRKEIEIWFTGIDLAGLELLGVQGADEDTGAISELFVLDVNDERTHWFITIFPNPDWEILTFVNNNINQNSALIHAIEVDTVSLPEPGTYAMLGTCLAVAGLARRKRVTI